MIYKPLHLLQIMVQ